MLAEVPRPPTGSVEEYPWKDGRTVSYRGRVRAYGRRYRLDFGTNLEGWSPARARGELDRIMAQVERGTWEPPDAAPVAHDDHETVHVTASRWWQRRQGELAENTRLDYRWRLDHVLTHLAGERTATLDVRAIDAFRDRLAATGLSPRSVNMMLDLLAQILDDAVEYGLLDANPARGKRRRMKVAKASRGFLDPAGVMALLDVAGEWERTVPEHQRYGRRAFVALLTLAGLRIGEACALDVRDVDLHAGVIYVRAGKTEAADRTVDVTFLLADELRGHLATRRPDPSGPLFPTRTGGRLNPSNIRTRLLATCVERARPRASSIPSRVTPHTLRRTFASLALAAGRNPRWVMAQIGHTDARLTLNVYAQVMDRRLDPALVWTLMRFPDEDPEQTFGPGIGPTDVPGLSSPAGRTRR